MTGASKERRRKRSETPSASSNTHPSTEPEGSHSRPLLGKRKSTRISNDESKGTNSNSATSKGRKKGKAKAVNQPNKSCSKNLTGTTDIKNLNNLNQSEDRSHSELTDNSDLYDMLVDPFEDNEGTLFGDQDSIKNYGDSSSDNDHHENHDGWMEYSEDNDDIDKDDDMDDGDDDDILFGSGGHKRKMNSKKDNNISDDDNSSSNGNGIDNDDNDDLDDGIISSSGLSRMRRNFGLPMLDIFGGMMTGMAGQFRNILENLSNHSDQTQQLIALQELAETLSISSEEDLAGSFQCDAFVRELVKIMKGFGDGTNPPGSGSAMDEDMMLAFALNEQYGGGNPELMLLACRCISNLLDVLPSSASSVVAHGAVGILCDKLKAIEYIDLAEQALGALEKVAGQAPQAVVQNGGLSASLMYFDFFSLHSQRTALQTASHCMRCVNSDSSQQVLEILPTLTTTLTYSDLTAVEVTCLCWARLSERYRSTPSLFEKAISIDVLKTMIGLLPVPGNSNAARPGAFNDILRVFRSVSKTSPPLGYQLLNLDIVGHFYQILTGAENIPSSMETSGDASLSSSLAVTTTLDNKWQDSLYAILKIIIDLLPPLPKDQEFSWKRFNGAEPVALRTRSSVPTLSETTTSPTSKPDPRIDLFKTNPQLLQRIGSIMFPLLLEIYSSTVNIRVRQLVTHILVKLVFFVDGEALKVVLQDVPLSVFLVGLLAQQEHSTFVIDALFQAEHLLKKLPGIYCSVFQREGVYYEIDALANKSLIEVGTLVENQHLVDEGRGLQQSDDMSIMSNATGPPSSPRSLDIPTSANNTTGGRNPTLQTQQHQHQSNTTLQSTSIPPLKNDKTGIGHGSLRKYIILHAQYLLKEYNDVARGLTKDGDSPDLMVNTVDELKKLSDGLVGTKDDPTARIILEKIVSYINGSSRGISGFELLRSGVVDALLDYLTQQSDTSDHSRHYTASLCRRRNTLYTIFMETIKLDEENGVLASPALRLLVKRLGTLFTQFERFEVVSPLDSSSYASSSDSIRNPVQLLAKQIRIRLTGQGPGIPTEYQHLIVATHAVATFRVLEEYLLSQIDDTDALMKLLNPGSSGDHSMPSSDDMDLEGDNKNPAKIIKSASEKKKDVDQKTSKGNPPRRASQRIKAKTTTPYSSSGTSAGTSTSSASTSKYTPATTANQKSRKNQKGKWIIQFYMNDTLISSDMTIYGAIHKSELKNNRQHARPSANLGVWSTAYPVTFKRVLVSDGDVGDNKKQKTQVRRQHGNMEPPKQLTENNSTCLKILQLLKELAVLSPSRQDDDDRTTTMATTMLVPQADFVNRKMAAKMQRQLEEPLIVASSCLPDWTSYLMDHYAFLFPFDVRYLFIQSTSFGYSRLIARWQSMQMRNNTQNGQRHDSRGEDGGTTGREGLSSSSATRQQPTLGNMERKKVLVRRDQILEYTVKIMDLFGSSQPVLEIEYADEEGSGLGPTLEFYALASKEFCKKSTNMWRQDDNTLFEGEGDNDKGLYVVTQQGLFPAPLSKRTDAKTKKKTIQLFKSLGQFVAKSMLDFRIIDIPFNAAFFKLLLFSDTSSVEIIKEVDPVLGKSISHLQEYVDKKRSIELDKGLTSKERAVLIGNIEVNGAKIQDLCLDFTLPGRPDIDLKRNGSQIPVTMDTVEEYIQLLTDMIVGSGVKDQISAFREGFNGLFSVEDLKVLTGQELVTLFGSSSEDWSYSTLFNTIKADHGFTMESATIKNLLEILSEMNTEDQRGFLQFTTGSPRLPIGGWKAMRPTFTVVRKNCDAPLTADDYLPSVMTCANYLKMPDYSSKKIMHKQLLKSMQEGTNSFLLS
ncbi:hypothetical protein BC941DRAFT_425909 [Chlamydoabsidia padenii]|nr:hypothetical protein BC941DRAFT_425909 [Chlamydoabsidia padenii]